VVLEYAALARGEDPGLEDAVTAFADKHAGPRQPAESAAGRSNSST
jgi:cytochrome c biogenesis protein